MPMSRHFVEGGSSFSPDVLESLTQDSPPLSRLQKEQRGGHRLLAALGLAGLLLAGGAATRVFMNFNSVKAQVEAPPDLGLGVKIVDNPPVGVAGNEPPPPATEAENKSAPKPEVKAFDCGILSPEACATGEYIQWTVPSGRKFTGIGFVLKAGEEIKIPENLQVAGEELPQPHTYNGFLITAARKDGTGEFNYFGSIRPTENKGQPLIEKVGKDLPAGTVVGTIDESKTTVFKESKHNLVVVFPTDKLENTFIDQTQKPPREINNTPVKATAGGGFEFFDVKPPKSS